MANKRIYTAVEHHLRLALLLTPILLNRLGFHIDTSNHSCQIWLKLKYSNILPIHMANKFYAFKIHQTSPLIKLWIIGLWQISTLSHPPGRGFMAGVTTPIPCISDYNTRSTQKRPVRQQNAWFDTKKSGSTQKCPVPHKNALPSMHQLTLPFSNIPPPVRIFFFQF